MMNIYCNYSLCIFIEDSLDEGAVRLFVVFSFTGKLYKIIHIEKVIKSPKKYMKNICVMNLILIIFVN